MANKGVCTMTTKLTVIFTLSLLFFSANSYACSFDTDYAVGSKCKKSSGQIYGYCANGMNPGNSNDRQPTREVLDISGKRGDTCSFDVDCGVGNKCYKNPRSSLNGVCVKK